ncbi:MAG TPA: tRNA (N(6)-L-threonylcarbamoyladenosine(37)-C(2))-methylthiotransferase MtaB [Oscillospiraceae bacterium]|nr:tRNA (N(6)-L-threonylcarbamoyladenosine(37)-C(2))-methylthiotransferase MtaB [Oscillospiraceae bacterium]
MKIAVYTLGCKVNQYESGAMERALQARGHTLVPFGEKADAYLVNTCTVTAVSDQKSRQIIHRARRENPDAVIGVCGCYAQTAPEAVRAAGADLVMGTDGRGAFLDALEEALREKRARPRGGVVRVSPALGHRTFEFLPAGGVDGRTRAMLKVEDGCVNFCTYCIIPYARGPVRSLPLEQAVSEAVRLWKEGYRELVVTGIEISSYGSDLPGKPGLIDLLEAISRAAPLLRIRLGSLEPRTVTEDFCVRAAKIESLCPHFHLSLQSGCDATLKRMNRKYDTARFRESVRLLREQFDHPAVTTDLIVGFPGETEAEFSETLSFIRACDFAAMHIFPYSRRSGTPAASMPGQVPRAEKARRARRAAAVAKEMEESYLTACVGKTFPVLFEEMKDGENRGHAPNYAGVTLPGPENLRGRVVPVRVTGLAPGGLTGEPVRGAQP